MIPSKIWTIAIIENLLMIEPLKRMACVPWAYGVILNACYDSDGRCRAKRCPKLIPALLQVHKYIHC